MKYIINRTYGGFTIPDQVMEALELTSAYDVPGDMRMNPHFIHWVEHHSAELAKKGRKSELAVVEIPDNATDWRLEEYDGLESITAVVDGKLVDIYG